MTNNEWMGEKVREWESETCHLATLKLETRNIEL